MQSVIQDHQIAHAAINDKWKASGIDKWTRRGYMQTQITFDSKCLSKEWQR